MSLYRYLSPYMRSQQRDARHVDVERGLAPKRKVGRFDEVTTEAVSGCMWGG
jgi:hypothetical protein